MFKTILVVCVMNSPMCPYLFQDTRGPWASPTDCLLRGAKIIHDMSANLPLINAQTFCQRIDPEGGTIEKKNESLRDDKHTSIIPNKFVFNVKERNLYYE